MTLDRRTLLATAAATPLIGRRARAANPKLKIGVLTDLSGPYKDVGGPVSAECVKLAFKDFGLAAHNIDADVIIADHQNKPDIGASLARQWYDRDGVDVIVDTPNSGVALAIAGVAKEKNKVFLPCNPATSDLTGKQCNANTIHWTYDTYMLSKSTGGAIAKSGGDSWFFLTADYAFGHALERDATAFIQGAGGKAAGSVSYPFPGTSDFSSFLLQAQSSGAKVIGLCSTGADVQNVIKQAHEFGITQTLAGLLVYIQDIHAIGLPIAQGLLLTNSFYWDANDRTRAFSERLKPAAPQTRPSMGHAGSYASVLHYLKVAAQAGVATMTADGAAAVAAMKKMPTDDDCFGPGTIRADGRKLHPAYLWKVKTPAESKGPWDYYKLVSTTPADEAFRPIEKGDCPLVHT